MIESYFTGNLLVGYSFLNLQSFQNFATTDFSNLDSYKNRISHPPRTTLFLKPGFNIVMTEENIKKKFRAHGISITAWAKENNFSVALVYAILAGRRKCVRGKSHEIAVRLGLKKVKEE